MIQLISSLVAALLALLAAAIACAEHDPLNYVCTVPINFQVNTHVEAFSNEVVCNRVNLDLSFDSGSNWTRRIANGLSVVPGSNTYWYSFRVTPDLWTEHARVAVRSLWSSTTNAIIGGARGRNEGDMSDADFSIAGCRLLSPTNGQVLRSPSYPTFTWHEAGSDTVTLGYSTNSGASWTALAIVPSPDPTNSYSFGLDCPTGRVWFVIQSRDDLFHHVECTVLPW